MVRSALKEIILSIRKRENSICESDKSPETPITPLKAGNDPFSGLFSPSKVSITSIFQLSFWPTLSLRLGIMVRRRHPSCYESVELLEWSLPWLNVKSSKLVFQCSMRRTFYFSRESFKSEFSSKVLTQSDAGTFQTF